MELATRRRFSIDDIGAMEEAGIFGDDERLELIDGELFVVNRPGPSHRMTVNRLTRLLTTRFAEPDIVQIQMGTALGSFDMPQPDLVVFAAGGDAYRRLVNLAHVKLLIEVSDSSVRFDRLVKAPLYARYGVLEYWIVDLVAHRIDVHTEPRDGAYRRVESFEGSEPIRSPALGAQTFAAADVIRLEDDLPADA